MDALGVIPVYLALVKKFERKKRLWIALREMALALGIMILFFFLGPPLLSMLKLNRNTTEIAGSIVIFLIAIKLIFPPEDDLPANKWGKIAAPLIVPIATPLIAGPSVLAVIMIYSQEESGSFVVLSAIFVAWLFSCILFLLSEPIYKFITEKGLAAAQRLMGLVIAIIATQMLIHGIKGLLR